MAKIAKTAIRSRKGKSESRLPRLLDLFNRYPDGAEIVPAKFSFAHRATFIPRRARNPRTELFLGHDFAALRRPSSDVVVAFRVTFPYRKRDYQKDFDILAYDDAFWWPLVMLCWEWEGHLSEQDCLKDRKRKLEFALHVRVRDRRHHAAAAGPKTRRPRRRANSLELEPRDDRRQSQETGAGQFSFLRRENMGSRRRATLSQFLALDLCGRGGQPGSGPHATALGQLAKDPPGDYEVAQRAIRAGKFLTAGRYDEADASAKAHSARAPHIEVMMPDLLNLVPARARLDAIFRLAFRFSLWAQNGLGSAIDNRWSRNRSSTQRTRRATTRPSTTRGSAR